MTKPTPADLHVGVHEGRDATQWGETNNPDDGGPASTGPLDEIKNGLKVWADIGLTIGKSVDQQTDTMRKALQRLERNTPIDYAVPASGVFPASGLLVLNFGTPDQGTYWEVASCAVGGTDVNVTAAGTAGLYVSAFSPIATNSGAVTTNPAGITSLVDRASALPNVAFYGTRQLLVNDQEYLFLVIFGGTSGQTYGANAQVTVYNVASAKGKTDIIA
jgi:hypothetical protein